MPSLVTTGVFGAANAVFWGLPFGKWVALVEDQGRRTYDNYLRDYQESFERLIGARVKQIEVSRANDQDGKIVLVFKNVSILDLEKLSEVADSEAQQSLDRRLAQHLSEVSTSNGEMVQGGEVGASIGLASSTEVIPDSGGNGQYYDVKIEVDSDATLGEVDFGSWEKAGLKCVVTKKGSQSTEGISAEERNKILNTLRCYSKLTQKQGFSPADKIDDRIIVKDERFLIGQFWNWWRSDKDHAVEQQVNVEKSAPDHIFAEEFVNSLKELSIVKDRPDLIEGYYQIYEHSLDTRKKFNAKKIDDYRQEYEKWLKRRRRYRITLIGGGVTAVVIVAVFVTLGIVFPTVGISMLTTTLGFVANEVLHLGKNINAWLFGGAIVGFFCKMVPEYDAQKLLMTKGKLEVQIELKRQLDRETEEVKIKKTHDLEFINNCSQVIDSKKLDLTQHDLTKNEIKILFKQLVEKNVALDELIVTSRSFSEQPLWAENLAKGVIPVSKLTLAVPVSKVTVADATTLTEEEANKILEMVQQNCTLTSVEFKWNQYELSLSDAVQNLVQKINLETRTNQSILNAVTMDDLTEKARQKLLKSDFYLATLSEGAGQLMRNLVQQNELLGRLLLVDDLSPDNFSWLYEAVQIDGVGSRVLSFWDKLDGKRQEALRKKIEASLKNPQSGQAAVLLPQLCYPKLSDLPEEAKLLIAVSFGSSNRLGEIFEQLASLVSVGDDDAKWRLTLIEKLSALPPTGKDLQDLISEIVETREEDVNGVKKIFKEILTAGAGELLKDDEIKQRLKSNELIYTILENYNVNPELESLLVAVLDGQKLIDLARDPGLRPVVLVFLQQVEWDSEILGENLGLKELWRCEMLNQLLKLRKNGIQIGDNLFQMVWGENQKDWCWRNQIGYVQLSQLIEAIKQDQRIEEARKVEMCRTICQKLLIDSAYDAEPPTLIMDIVMEYPQLLKDFSDYPKLISAVRELLRNVETLAWSFVEALFESVRPETLNELFTSEKGLSSKDNDWSFVTALIKNMGDKNAVKKITLPQVVWRRYFEQCGETQEEATNKAEVVSKLFAHFDELTSVERTALYWSVSWAYTMNGGRGGYLPRYDSNMLEKVLTDIDPQWRDKYLRRMGEKSYCTGPSKI